MKETKHKLLDEWFRVISQVAKAGALGKNVQIYAGSRAIAGPRAGVLELVAGVDNEGSHAGRMLKSLTANDFALHRQLIPWQFIGEPAVFMSGKFVRLEAAWPGQLAENDIPLSSIPLNPTTNTVPVRWVVGKNELGSTVTISASDRIPHFLFPGQTGSGKTVAMQSAIGQMARNTHGHPNVVKFVLIDAKYGTGLRPLAHIPGLIGPLVDTLEDAKKALAWTVTEMRSRLLKKSQMSERDWDAVPPIMVAIDEIQEVTRDPLAVELIRVLAAQGREAKIHLLVGTQHPIIEAFGNSSIKRNIAAGVIALKVNDAKASEVAVGGSDPRADRLLGAGDSYVIAPGVTHRTQVAYMTKAEMRDIPGGGQPEINEWPEVDSEIGVQSNEPGNALYNADEVALAVLNAKNGGGRDALKSMMEQRGMTKPGSPKAVRLRDYGRTLYEALTSSGYDLCPVQRPILPESSAGEVEDIE